MIIKGTNFMKKLSCSCVVGMLVIFAIIAGVALAQDAVTIQVISHRSPSLEYFAQAMTQFPDSNVKVEVTLMPQDEVDKIAILNLSAGSSAYDIFWTTPDRLNFYVSNGWAEPLNDYIQKYTDEYDLDKVADTIMNGVKKDNITYGIPVYFATEIWFYRGDVYTDSGLTPPQTFDDIKAIAEKLKDSGSYPLTMAMKQPGPMSETLHWFLNAHNAQWFDKDWNLVLDNQEALTALETANDLLKYMPPDVSAYTNDEVMVSLQQGTATSGLAWSTRALRMDDIENSKVVNLMQYTRPPSVPGAPAGPTLSLDGYFIPKFSKNKEIAFKVLAHLISYDVQYEGRQLYMPVREDILADPAFVSEYRFIPAIFETINSGAYLFPPLPEMLQVREIVGRNLSEAFFGSSSIKEAVGMAKEETYNLLESLGYH
jgi:multiple sugar transport system substrate-binding protein